MTKNEHVEFINSNNKVATLLNKLEKRDTVDASRNTGSLEMDSEGEEKPNFEQQRPKSNSFKGLQDMQLDKADLLDSFDLDEDTEILNGIGTTKIIERLKDLTSEERYRKTVSA